MQIFHLQHAKDNLAVVIDNNSVAIADYIGYCIYTMVVRNKKEKTESK